MRKFEFSLTGLVSYSYVIIAAGLSRLTPLSESMKSLIAQPAIILIPYLVGKPLFYFTRKVLSIKEPNDFAVNMLVTWSLGTVVMVTIETILYVNYLFSLDSFVIILMIIGIFSVFIRERVNSNNLKHKEIAIVAVYGFLFALFVTNFWPYPHANDNDYITHLFYTLKIVTQNRPLIFYGDYLPTMHTLYAVMMKLFSIKPYGDSLYLLWASRFILYPVYAVGLYLFAYRFSKDKLLALLVSLIGSSLSSTVNGTLFPYHTAPKNFIDLLIIYGFYTALSFNGAGEKKRNPLPYLFALGALLLLVFIPLYYTGTGKSIGYEIGFILPVILLIVLALSRFAKSEQRSFFLSMSLVLAVMVFISKMQGFQAGGVILALLFFNWLLERLNLNRARLIAASFVGFALTEFIMFYFRIVPYPKLPFLRPNDTDIGLFGINTLVKYINSFYPFSLIFLFAAGCFFFMLSKHAQDKKFFSPIILTSLILMAFFSPIYMSFRFLGDAHPLIILMVVFAIFKILRVNEITLKAINTLLPLLLVIAFLGIAVITNDIKTFKTGDSYIYKKDTFQVFQVGDFIKEHVDKSAIIIESKFYQQLSAFYGGVDTTFLWRAGRFQDSYVMDIYNAGTAEEAYGKAKVLLNMQEQVVRYADKDGKEVKRFYKEPSDIILLCDDYIFNYEDAPDAARFLDPRYFEILFVTKNSTRQNFYVIRVKPEPVAAGFPNLVKNPSFEESAGSPKSATFWKLAWDTRWSGALDNTVKYDGNYSYRMETNVTQSLSWSAIRGEDIQVKGGKAYLFSGRMKTQNARSSFIEIDYFDNTTNKYVAAGTLGRPNATENWKAFSKLIEVPAGVESLTIYGAAGWVSDPAKGTAITWFDDIQLIGPIEITASASGG